MLLVCQLPLVAFYNKINLTQLLEQVIKRNEVRKPGLPTENPWIEADSLANTLLALVALSFLIWLLAYAWKVKSEKKKWWMREGVFAP